MSNLSEPTNNEQENLRKSGQKLYSAATRTTVIGGIVSFLFALPAIAIFFRDNGLPGLGFFVFGFLALAAFIISCFIAILTSLAGVINYATILNQNLALRDETLNGITKSVGLILGIILALLIVFKLFKTIW